MKTQVGNQRAITSVLRKHLSRGTVEETYRSVRAREMEENDIDGEQEKEGPPSR